MQETRQRHSAQRDRTPNRFNTQLFLHQYKDSHSKSKGKNTSPKGSPRESLQFRESQILSKIAAATKEGTEADLFDHKKNLQRLRSILKESRKKDSKLERPNKPSIETIFEWAESRHNKWLSQPNLQEKRWAFNLIRHRGSSQSMSRGRSSPSQHMDLCAMKETLQLNQLAIETGSKGFEVNEIIKAVNQSSNKQKQEELKSQSKSKDGSREKSHRYATGRDMFPNRKDYNLYTITKAKDNIETKPDLNTSNDPLSASNHQNISLSISKDEEELRAGVITRQSVEAKLEEQRESRKIQRDDSPHFRIEKEDQAVNNSFGVVKKEVMEPAREQGNDLLINSNLSKEAVEKALQNQRDRLGLLKASSGRQNKKDKESGYQDGNRSNRWMGGVRQYKTKITFHYRDSKQKQRMTADDYYFPKPVVVKVRELTPEQIQKLPPPPPILHTNPNQQQSPPKKQRNPIFKTKQQLCAQEQPQLLPQMSPRARLKSYQLPQAAPNKQKQVKAGQARLLRISSQNHFHTTLAFNKQSGDVSKVSGEARPPISSTSLENRDSRRRCYSMPKITFTYLPSDSGKGTVRNSQRKGSPIIALQSMKQADSIQRQERQNPYADVSASYRGLQKRANRHSIFQPKILKGKISCENQYRMQEVAAQQTLIRHEAVRRSHANTHHQPSQVPPGMDPSRMRMKSIARSTSQMQLTLEERDRAKSMNEQLRGTIKKAGHNW